MQIPAYVLRVPCDYTTNDSFVDARSKAAVIPRNATVQIACALFVGTPASATFVNDLDNIATANLVVRQGNNPSGVVLIEKVIPAASFNKTLAFADWTAGNGAHFTFDLSSTDTNQAGGPIYIAIGVALTDGSDIPVAFSATATLLDRGIFNPGPPTAPDYTSWSKAEADGRYARLGADGGLHYEGNWNAATNVPAITSGTAGTGQETGSYYVVGTSGTTTVDGVSSWAVGDWIVFSGARWDTFSGPAADTPAARNAALAGLNSRFPLITVDMSQPTDAAYMTAALQAAFDYAAAHFPAGARIYLPGGVYSLNPGLMVTSPILLVGDGAGAVENYAGPGAALGAGFTPGGTTLLTTATTGNLITCALTAPACGFENLAICNLNARASAPTAGCAIQLLNATNAHSYKVTIVGFWDGWDIVGGYGWKFTDPEVDSCGRYGIYIRDTAIPDGGDPSIMGLTAAGYLDRAPGTAAIYQESGGGVKVSNAKGNGGYLHFILLNIGTGNSTSILLLANSSIENMLDFAVVLQTNGSGQFASFNFIGNHLANQPGGIQINGTGLSVGNISDNILNHIAGGGGRIGIWARAGARIHVGTNTFSDVDNAVLIDPVSDGALTDMHVDKQAVLGGGNVVINNATGSARAVVDYDYKQPLDLAATATPYTAFSGVISNYTGGHVRVFVAGVVSGVDRFSYYWEGTYQKSGGAATLTPFSAPVSGGVTGTNVTIAFGVASDGATIQLILTPDGSHTVIGTASFCADGELASFTLGI